MPRRGREEKAARGMMLSRVRATGCKYCTVKYNRQVGFLECRNGGYVSPALASHGPPSNDFVPNMGNARKGESMGRQKQRGLLVCAMDGRASSDLWSTVDELHEQTQTQTQTQ
jgi:hypothetical protein